MALQPINGVEEVNIFINNGEVIHIKQPKSQYIASYYGAQNLKCRISCACVGCIPWLVTGAQYIDCVMFLRFASAFIVLVFSVVGCCLLCVVANNSFVCYAVQGSVPSNTFVISGAAESKQLTELLPGILNQLGPESMDRLRKYAESLGVTGAGAGAAEEEDDDEVPELVENFEEAAAK